jgi:hypothetical protein
MLGRDAGLGDAYLFTISPTENQFLNTKSMSCMLLWTAHPRTAGFDVKCQLPRLARSILYVYAFAG